MDRDLNHAQAIAYVVDMLIFGENYDMDVVEDAVRLFTFNVSSYHPKGCRTHLVDILKTKLHNLLGETTFSFDVDCACTYNVDVLLSRLNCDSKVDDVKLFSALIRHLLDYTNGFCGVSDHTYKSAVADAIINLLKLGRKKCPDFFHLAPPQPQRERSLIICQDPNYHNLADLPLNALLLLRMLFNLSLPDLPMTLHVRCKKYYAKAMSHFVRRHFAIRFVHPLTRILETQRANK